MSCCWRAVACRRAAEVATPPACALERKCRLFHAARAADVLEVVLELTSTRSLPRLCDFAIAIDRLAIIAIRDSRIEPYNMYMGNSYQNI